MAAFYLKCNTCNKEIRKLWVKFKQTSCECGGDFVRLDKNNASAMIKETLDNGAMVRKVERIHNIDELVRDRSKHEKDGEFV